MMEPRAGGGIRYARLDRREHGAGPERTSVGPGQWKAP